MGFQCKFCITTKLSQLQLKLITEKIQPLIFLVKYHQKFCNEKFGHKVFQASVKIEHSEKIAPVHFCDAYQ